MYNGIAQITARSGDQIKFLPVRVRAKSSADKRRTLLRNAETVIK